MASISDFVERLRAVDNPQVQGIAEELDVAGGEWRTSSEAALAEATARAETAEAERDKFAAANYKLVIAQDGGEHESQGDAEAEEPQIVADLDEFMTTDEL